MGFFVNRNDSKLEVTYQHEVLRIDPWGRNAFRVRIAQHEIKDNTLGALGNQPQNEPVQIRAAEIGEESIHVSMVNGDAEARVDFIDADAAIGALVVSFRDIKNDRVVLSEKRQHFWWPGAHSFRGRGSGKYRVTCQFEAYQDEKLYGLGQRTHGVFDQKGMSLELIQRNGEINIPVLLSNRGYLLLWNNPCIGRVEMSQNATTWINDQTDYIDYWICIDQCPAHSLRSYMDAVGHAPELPEWATGFWQSKLRYESQEELLEVAREYHRRKLPLSVIVTDFFHWTSMGDYRFDPLEYPDPDHMIRELEQLGTKLMVSIWPTISPLSENYDEMYKKGFLVSTDQGPEFHQCIHDKKMSRDLPVSFYDSTNPKAREFLFSKIKKNYLDHGVNVWWLDACEPELNPGDPSILSFYAGPGSEVANIYPLEHARGFAEGLLKAGANPSVLLCRSAWAGQAKYGAAIWSGDVRTTWQALREQIPAGLNAGLCGFPWWTHDIGGFHGGDPDDEAYRELFVRWFEFGVYSPLFRLHGHREPRGDMGSLNPGGPNEIWSYGSEVYEIAKKQLCTREALRPYILEQMKICSEVGVPFMRPLFLEYPEDRQSWEISDQFFFGTDYLVAPVLSPGERSRTLYLPAKSCETADEWQEIHTGKTFTGGQRVEVEAPLEYIPVLVRTGTNYPDEIR